MRRTPGRLMLLALLVLPGRLAAQEQYPLSGTHVPEHPRATALVDRGNEALRDGRWADAVRAYQEAMERFPERLIPFDAGFYRGVGHFCRERLAQMPPAGVDAYREAFDVAAQEALNEALRGGDAGALRATAERWPLATTAPATWGLLGDLLLEQLRTEEALESYLRAGDLAPGRRARAAWAAAEVADEAALKLLAPKPGDGATKIRAGDGEMSFHAFFDRLRVTERTPAGDDRWTWPTSGGQPDRNGMASPLATLPDKLCSLTWPEYPYRPPLYGALGRYGREEITDDLREGFYPLFPVFAEGRIFLSNDTQVVAVDLASPLEGSLWRYGTDLLPRLLAFEERAMHTISVADGRVFVPLATTVARDETKMQDLLVKYPRPSRALHAFAAASGNLLWKIGGGEFREGDFLGSASFPMAPLVLGDRLYVAAVFAGNQTNLFEHYVCCLDAADGRLLWRTFLGSGFLEINLFNNPLREPLGSVIASDGARLYVVTNMGVAAALDRATGFPIWEMRYRQYELEPTLNPYAPQRLPLGWVNNPPIVADGDLFFAPFDSPYLYVVDAAGGGFSWKAEINPGGAVSTPGWSPYRYLLGVQGDRIYLQGRQVLALSRGREGRRMWAGPRGTAVIGRGRLSRDGVYVATSDGLLCLDFETGRTNSRARWPEPTKDPGSIWILEDMVVTAGPERVGLFVRWDAALERIKARIGAAPKDAGLQLQAGRLCLGAGRTEEAEQHLEKALRLAPKDSETQRVAANTIIAVLLARGKELQARGRRDQAAEAFRRARDLSRDAVTGLPSVQALAVLEMAEGKAPDAVREWQALLAQFPDARLEEETLRDRVRGEIGAILLAHGEDAYVEEERKAAALLQQALRQPTLAALRRVWELYPNARAGERAQLLAVRAEHRTGQVASASEILVRFLRENPESSLLAEALAWQVVCHEARQMWSSARGSLRRLARRFPHKLLAAEFGPPGVREVDVFVAQRKGRPEYVRAGGEGIRPTVLRPPLVDVARFTTDDREPIRTWTPDGSPPASARGLAFAVSADYLLALSATGLRWRCAIPQYPQGIHFAGDLLLVATRETLQALNPADGSERWRGTLAGRFRGWVVTPEKAHIFLIPHRGIGQSGSGSGRLMTIDTGAGGALWERDVAVESNGYFAGGEQVLVLPSLRHRTVLLLDPETGREIATLAVGDALDSVRFVAPDRLVTQSPEGILTAYDATSGRQLWAMALGRGIPGTLAASGDAIVFVRSGSQRQDLVWVDLETGEVLGAYRTGQGSRPLHVLAGDDRVFLTYRDDRTAADGVTIVGIDGDGDSWSKIAPIYRESVFMTPILTRDHIVLPSAALDRDNKVWTPEATLVERADGETVQILRLDSQGRMPTLDVGGDLLLMAQDQQVRIYGHK